MLCIALGVLFLAHAGLKIFVFTPAGCALHYDHRAGLAVKIVAHPWRWLAQSKDQISALQSLAAIFALVVGAVWVLIHVDILSELVAEVQLEQTFKAYNALEDVTILQVDVTLKNASKRSVTYYCKEIFIKEFLPLSKEDAEMAPR